MPAPYGDGLQLGTGPISLVLGLVLIGVIALIDFRYRRTGTQNDAGAPAASVAPGSPAAEEGGAAAPLVE